MALPRELLLLAGLTIGAMACEPDTSKDGSTTDNADGGAGDDGLGGDGTGDGGSGDGGSGDGGSGDGGSGDGSGDGSSVDCSTPVDLSVWLDADTFDASLLTTTPYSNDAGIGAVLAAVPGDGETVAVDLAINEAVITNVGYAPDGASPDIWFADASGALFTYRVEGTVGAKPGDTVSMVVTEITNYFGKPEITGATNVTVSSSAQPIYYIAGTGTSLDYATQGRQNVHLYGTLVAEEGACGGSYTCFTMDHGGQTVTYRINLENLGDYPDQVGDCIQVFAPMDVFDGAPQMNITNYDWRYVVFL